jgi:hypothetical protein
MSVKEQFYNQRPAVLFDPRASQRIDPRFKFTRDGAASYIDRDGVLQVNGAPANQPRVGFNYEPDSDGILQLVQGIAIEEQRTNSIRNNTMVGAVAGTPGTLPTNWSASDAIGGELYRQIVGAGTQNGINYIDIRYSGTVTGARIASIFPEAAFGISASASQVWTGSGYFAIVGGSLANIATLRLQTDSYSAAPALRNTAGLVDIQSQISSALTRYSWSGTTASGDVTSVRSYFSIVTATSGAIDITLRIGLPQLELGTFVTSPIATTTTAVTRPADLLSFNTEVPSSGSLYIDAEASSAGVGNTLLSAANASDEKLLLQVQQPANLYNGVALVYSIDESFEPTLPFPIPEPGAQRNIITWGANNFHYQQSNYRKTPSLTAAVPESMNRIGIGHDITDPTKGFNGVISRLYLWANELPPEIARGLVRGNITVPFNADDGNIIPADAQVFVFNTQGDTFTGDKVVRFQLLGSNNSISIDWGDGITETYAGSAANTTITHTYETAGLYLVSITGVFENIKLGNFTGSQATDLVSVLQYSPDWSPTNLTDLYNGCLLLPSSSLDNFPDTSLITQFSRAFEKCSSLTSFPLIDTSAGINFNNAWLDCSSLTSFPLINTSAGINFTAAWGNCSSLTSFPLINTATVTNMNGTWSYCSSLTSFPLLDTSNVTLINSTWRNCVSLTSFPVINTSAVTRCDFAWAECYALTSFPVLDLTGVVNWEWTWFDCRNLTAFPLLDFSNAVSMSWVFGFLRNITEFPLIDTSNCINLGACWFLCDKLTSFPQIDTSKCLSLRSAWALCAALTTFPVLATQNVKNFRNAWAQCSSLTSFPELDFSSAAGFPTDPGEPTGFSRAWAQCTALATFPPNRFDNVTTTQFFEAFISCALTPQSIENILVSINTANTSNGVLSLEGGTNAVKTSWTANANTAYDALVARGWTITFRP